MRKNIVLVGFMGAGKSVVAKRLEEFCKRQRVSSDDLIEKKENRSITDIFRDSGEVYFRKVEKGVIEELSTQENLIIDCGGGVVLNQENIENLKKNGKIFYLSTTPSIIYERIKDQKHRPLLHGNDPQAKINELLKIRQSQYKEADHIIDTNNQTIEQVAQEILGIMKDE